LDGGRAVAVAALSVDNASMRGALVASIGFESDQGFVLCGVKRDGSSTRSPLLAPCVRMAAVATTARAARIGQFGDE
jgi:hypothetical protein